MRLVIGNGTELAVMVGQDTFPAIWKSWSRSFNEAIGNNTRQAIALAGLVFGLFALPWLVLATAVAMTVTSIQTLAGSPWVGAVLMGVAMGSARSTDGAPAPHPVPKRTNARSPARGSI